MKNFQILIPIDEKMKNITVNTIKLEGFGMAWECQCQACQNL